MFGVLHPDFFWVLYFLKLMCGWFKDTRNPWAVGLKKFDIQCHWENIFFSLEKI